MFRNSFAALAFLVACGSTAQAPTAPVTPVAPVAPVETSEQLGLPPVDEVTPVDLTVTAEEAAPVEKQEQSTSN